MKWKKVKKLKVDTSSMHEFLTFSYFKSGWLSLGCLCSVHRLKALVTLWLSYSKALCWNRKHKMSAVIFQGRCKTIEGTFVFCSRSVLKRRKVKEAWLQMIIRPSLLHGPPLSWHCGIIFFSHPESHFPLHAENSSSPPPPPPRAPTQPPTPSHQGLSPAFPPADTNYSNITVQNAWFGFVVIAAVWSDCRAEALEQIQPPTTWRATVI